MSAARLADANSEIVSVLPPTAIYRLAAPSTPDSARQEIVARIGNGEAVSVKDANEAIAAAKGREAKEAREEAERQRVARLPPDAKRRDLKRKERLQLERERWETERRQGEEAAREAAELLVGKLGADVNTLLGLIERAGYYRVKDALRALGHVRPTGAAP